MQNVGSNPNKPKSGSKKISKWVLQGLFICFVIVLVVAVGTVGVGAGIVSAYAKDEKIRGEEDYQKELEGWSQTSYAYFRSPDGKKQPEKIGEMVSPEDRRLIRDLDEVSPYLVEAFLSVEDREFYQHKGINPQSLLRAAFQEFTGSEVSTGGSTITQQLVKRVLLTPKQTYERKALEIINAIRIEKFYSKEQIFVAYMNNVYFGVGAHNKHMYGVAAAARGLFNTDVKKLDLAQAAYIAGMVQRPNAYNPFEGEKQLKLGLERMKLVLDQMLVNKKITQQQYNEAIKFDIKGSLAKKSDFKNAFEKYPFIIRAVEREAAEILQEKDKGKNKKSLDEYRKQVNQGGLHIYTTIDEELYNKMNKSVEGLYFPSKKIRGKKRTEQIGAVLIENKTGAVLSFYAGTDFDKNQQDHAFVATNQPGSAMKPLLGYGPALNEGIISPDSTIIDEPIQKADGSGTYKNSGGKYKNGPVTATHALKYSYNIPAVKIFRKVGIERGFSYLEKMGMKHHPRDGEASVLGGLTNGYTVEQMTAAYAMIANQGKYNKPHLIEKIVDSQGNEIYNYHKENKPIQIFTPQTSYALTKMMEQVVRGGTGDVIGKATSGYNVAGKTGTTSNEWDLWFVGYTPEVSLGVWSGYDYNAKGSKYLAKNAWIKLFKAAAAANPKLIPRGSDYPNPGGGISTKCFECNRVKPDPEPQPGGNPGTNPGPNPGTNPNPNPWPNPGPNPGPNPPGGEGPNPPGDGDDGGGQNPPGGDEDNGGGGQNPPGGNDRDGRGGIFSSQ
ncbi:transglycosylase domain-containing protein [Paenactinomyces guangxiensis]|uniref:Penicillin-binding protein n=1 Tax=Paenactinomyces guangxiensis TaxID=1490290 RepID=A0A7W1WMX0_9BACL|nr:transglycosylase domain-containing protein [Paenactinomyces guangxiensis]MBA4492834.1 penicillin-binding protein [Paenactinomyces guangxiensis]MBH8590317.1 penicillin-binding protein [Paenactinomyces guangxiensis]